MATIDPRLDVPVPKAGAGEPERDADMLDVTVVVPVDSESAEVQEVAEALGKELDFAGRSWEIFFVFDGVTGQAFEQVQALRAEMGSKVKSISFKNPFGESVCLSAAFERSKGRFILTAPQYVQVDPAEVPGMLQALEGGADFVTPWRIPRVDPWLNQLQSAIFNLIIRQVVRMHFHDLNCYFRAIRREVLEDVAIYGDMYRFLPVIAHRQGYRVDEVKVRHLKEWGKAGFFGLGVYVRRFLDVLAVMFLSKFTLKPLRFFGTVGGLFSMLGAGMILYLTILKFVFNEGVGGRPLLVVGVMLFVLGVQIIGFGLVGEIIIFSQAKNLKEYRIERIYDREELES